MSLGNLVAQQNISTTQKAATELTKFDLDFAGGTPRELVAAIQKASGQPVNAIIPDEFAETRVPALKMKNVDVSRLFTALSAASQKPEVTDHGLVRTSYCFQSQGEISFNQSSLYRHDSTIAMIATPGSSGDLHELNDDELLDLAAPRTAILVYHGPHNSELLFLEPQDSDRL